MVMFEAFEDSVLEQKGFETDGSLDDGLAGDLDNYGESAVDDGSDDDSGGDGTYSGHVRPAARPWKGERRSRGASQQRQGG